MQSKILISILISCIFFSSGCNKDTEKFQSYLRFKLDNAQIECNAHINATYMPATIGPDNIITISGNWPDGSISLELNEAQVLTTTEYTFRADKSRRAFLWITISPGSTRIYSAGDGGIVNNTVIGSGKITITEINPDYIKGTFEFVTGVEMFTNTIKTVTGGEFHIKRG